jgi:hypothetical protein
MKITYPILFFLFTSFPSLIANTYFVTNANDSGPGSLREAIIQANNNPGPDNIHFKISGAGPHEIALNSQLPFVTDPAIIDGYTQEGAVPATGSTKAVLMIGLNGENIIGDAHGFAIGSDCTIRGFAIYNFDSAVNMATNNNVVEGCYIGLDLSGTVAMGNQFDGIFITGQGNRIGGPSPAQRNVISANGNGIAGFPYANNNLIQGNYIGTDADGTTTIANNSDGIGVGSANNQILDNLVVGHQNSNILIGWWFDASPYPNNNVVAGNHIGHHIDGSLSTGINCQGISIVAATNTVVRDNIIQGNNCHGVHITFDVSTGNLITTNAIYDNANTSINLGDDEVTPNDSGDLDTGPNNLLNFPVLEEATLTPGGTLVKGFIDTPDPKTVRVEYYSISSPHSSGYGGGETFLGAGTPNSNGKIKDVLPAVAPGSYITAIAIDRENNTSEFALNILAENRMGAPENNLSILPKESTSLAEQLLVMEAFPNPSSGNITLRYYLPEAQKVKLFIIDQSGRKLRTLANSYQEAGAYQLQFDGKDLQAGVYTYQLVTSEQVTAGKLIINSY